MGAIEDFESGYSSNLEDFVVSPVEITDILGNPVTNYYLGTDYYVKITFSETATLQFEYFLDTGAGTSYMTYQLPPQFIVQQSLVDKSPFPILGESLSGPDPIIGYVSIDIDRLIKVHFDDVDINGNPALVFDDDLQDYVLVNFIDYYSDASFLLDIATQFSQVGSDQEINFGNDVTVTVTVESPLPGTLSITKTNNVTSALANKTVEFTVVVTALDGPVQDITLSDFGIPGTNDLITAAVFSDMVVSVSGGTPYTPPEFASLLGEPFGSGFTLAFNSVTLSPGKQIIVVFTLDIEDVIDKWVADNPSDAGAYNYEFVLYNRATAQGVDEYTTPTPQVLADTSAWITRRFLSKAGTQDLAHDYTVLWFSWAVGDGITPLNGYTITDTLTGLVFDDSNLLPNGENGIVFTFWDEHGNGVGTLFLPVAAGATGFSFTVPNDYGPITRVTIDYTISTRVADTSDFDDTNTVSYYNTVSVDITTPNPSYTTGVVVTKPGRLPTATKAGTFGGSGSSIDYVEWTYTLYVPKEAYGHPISINDDSFVAYDGLHRLYPRAVPENLEIKVYSSNLGERTLTRNVDFTLLDPDHTNGYTNIGNIWFLFFVGDTTGLSWGELSSASVWPYNEDTWLTMTFRLPLSTMCYDSDYQITLLEALQRYSFLHNYLYINSYLLNFDTYAVLKWPIQKMATVSGNTIKYQITFAADNFNFADVFTDTFDPLLEYVPFSMRVWYSGSAGANYGLYQMVGGTFSDMLAENLIGNTMSFDFTNMYRILWDTSGASYWDNPGLLSDNPIADTYYIEYTLKLKDDAPLGQHILDNNVLLNNFTNFAEAVIGQKIVEKSMATTSNIATVSIIINPEEKILAGASGQYTITDILSDTLLMYISTIKVEAWEGGMWVVHALTASAAGDLWTYTTTGASQISFVVPDGTMLRITYNALIKGTIGDTVTINNQVTVAGQYYDFVEELFLITDTSASCSGSRTTLTVIKYDTAEPDILLSGAIFALYIGITYAGWDTVKVPTGIDRTITVGTMSFYYISSSVTGANGRITFDNLWLTPTHMAVYALKEYQAALGYEMPAEAIGLFSYTVPSAAQQEALLPYSVQQIADTIAVPNTKQADLHAIIRGYKTVTGNDAPDKTFTFCLTQIADSSGTDMPTPYTDTTTTLGQGEFGFPLAGLTTSTTYYYKITEDTGAADAGWTYDPQSETGQIVTVAVEDDNTVTITYPGGRDSVNFTNKYSVKQRPTHVSLSANKVAIGAPLPLGKFLFGLFDNAGNLIDTSTLT